MRGGIGNRHHQKLPPLAAAKERQSSATGGTKKENHIKYCRLMTERQSQFIKKTVNNLLFAFNIVLKTNSIPPLAGEKEGNRPPQAERKKKIISNIVA
jgi:hypothetical protein